MKALGPRGVSWLKSFHIFVSGVWVGAGICMIMISYFGRPANGDELYATNAAAKLIDDFVVIPAAISSLLTGLVYSVFTKWGFFKHRWVTVKWVVTVFSILFGTFFLGPWLNDATSIAASERWMALNNPIYVHSITMNRYFGTMQVASLIFLVFISVIKPWRKNSTTVPE
ncbi:hypothetical protein H1S01_07370 [Heliobacterium chlorum]|uniref:DUF2269 domain-containing protein n=1 Tax=Heliobacterium chlorum TaxID=2698 RepID=A0ABR7T3A2_HELCL|nr:hypothetical protein [Heliobacterium chlorum]MBC9784329.1 hypothetical protein [Heliobacterium chlorum]